MIRSFNGRLIFWSCNLVYGWLTLEVAIRLPKLEWDESLEGKAETSLILVIYGVKLITIGFVGSCR